MTLPHAWCPSCMGCHVDEEKPQDHYCNPEAQLLCFWMKPTLDASESPYGLNDVGNAGSTDTETE
jgi:hypothetical protein